MLVAPQAELPKSESVIGNRLTHLDDHPLRGETMSGKMQP
jgi:hypothetical protein